MEAHPFLGEKPHEHDDVAKINARLTAQKEYK